jgi:AGCS family alanine or glycine:cation symporter
MIIAGFLGMSSKMVECTLAQIYREVRPDGKIMGGAMEYISRGFKEIGWTKTGKVLGTLFAVFCMGSSLGGGSSFQVSQSYSTLAGTITWFADHSWLYGFIMAVLVGAVILGGINRIAHVASAVVPLMCGVYIALCLAVLFQQSDKIPWAFSEIIKSALTPEAGFGGFIGVLVVGFQRAAFSNEAGVGSAAIAHSAAKTKYPAREGFVALLEPLIDTVIVCTMTALVIVITGAYNNPDYAEIRKASQGATLTLKAFESIFTWSPYFITFAVFLFAYSTIISWYYYGERCFTYLFGEKFCVIFKWTYIFIVFVSSSISAGNILTFSDLMLLGMALINIFGLYVLFEKVKLEIDKYWQMYRQNKFD